MTTATIEELEARIQWLDERQGTDLVCIERLQQRCSSLEGYRDRFSNLIDNINLRLPLAEELAREALRQTGVLPKKECPDEAIKAAAAQFGQLGAEQGVFSRSKVDGVVLRNELTGELRIFKQWRYVADATS